MRLVTSVCVCTTQASWTAGVCIQCRTPATAEQLLLHVHVVLLKCMLSAHRVCVLWNSSLITQFLCFDDIHYACPNAILMLQACV